MYFEDFKCRRATSSQTINPIVTCRALQIIVQVTVTVQWIGHQRRWATCQSKKCLEQWEFLLFSSLKVNISLMIPQFSRPIPGKGETSIPGEFVGEDFWGLLNNFHLSVFISLLLTKSASARAKNNDHFPFQKLLVLTLCHKHHHHHNLSQIYSILHGITSKSCVPCYWFWCRLTAEKF